MAWQIAFDAVLVGLCLVVVVMDLRHGIIPDWTNAALALLGLIAAYLSGRDVLIARCLDAVLIGAFLLLLRYAHRRWRGRTGLGLGDVKFLTAGTLLTGLGGIQIAILVACVSAFALIGLMRLKGTTVTATSRLRFGPHLALGLMIAVFFFPDQPEMFG
jgi:leader peptidase (prepilin peptidase)/N-methyltransferase